MTKKPWKMILKVLLLLIITLICMAFLSGPLFPWSPIKIGYVKQAFSRASVYFPVYTICPSKGIGIEEIMSEAEEFHGLEFQGRIKIIFCNSWGLFQRGRLSSLGLRPGGPLACAIATGTVIYFSPGLKDSGRNLRNLLKHELSHAIRYQNTNLLQAYFHISRELGWLDEGVAVYFGNASDYPGPEEFRKLALEEGYLFRIGDEREAEKIPIEKRHRFRYAEYGYFFSYLIHRFSQKTVLEYVRKTNQKPEQHKALFLAAFKISFHDLASDFEQAVRQGNWPPIN